MASSLKICIKNAQFLNFYLRLGLITEMYVHMYANSLGQFTQVVVVSVLLEEYTTVYTCCS